jgi:internalin A
LSKLNNIETLSLSQINIDNIDFLKSLKKLKDLSISNTNIKDISILKQLPNLIKLDASKNIGLKIPTLKNLKYLDISNCGISDMSDLENYNSLEDLVCLSNDLKCLKSIDCLSNLKSVNLGDNKLRSVLPIKNNKTLKNLWLIGNRIEDANELRELTQLESLSLGDNNISDISFLENLNNLRRLYLHDNNITEISCLSGLHKIEDLNLRSNNISDIKPLKELKNIKIALLQNNPITEISSWILDMNLEIVWNKYGSRSHNTNNCIVFFNSPLKNPPIEIIKQGNDSIKRYFDKIISEGAEVIHEVKVTLVGEGNAGKTSLTNRLLRKNSSLPKAENRTRGIKIQDWVFKRGNKNNHIAHIWDFGGQDVYYPVHRFFITENSLFVLLASTRQTHHNFDYWIPTIYQFGGNSPIILGQTCHDGNKVPWNDLGTYLSNTNFNVIKTQNLPYYELNLPNKNEGLDIIKEVIINQITNLSHYGRQVPKSWAAVREVLVEEAKKSSCISFEKFKELCVKSNPLSFKQLSDFSDCCQFLHDIGIVLWYSSQKYLKSWVVIEPQWAMNAVYEIIDDNEIQSKNGNISKNDFVRIWKSEEYVNMHDVLKEMLEVFKIAFPKKHKENEYIIPARLISMPIEKKWNTDEHCLRLEYRFEFMPRGLVNQLSAELSRYIVSDEEVWNNAVNFSFKIDTAYAQVEENFYNRNLTVISNGKEARSLIILIMNALRNITEGYKGVNPKIFVPCMCEYCFESKLPETFQYNKLMDWSKRRDHVTCNESGKNMLIDDLLYKIGLKNQFSEMTKESFDSKNKKMFISYSKYDADYLQDFQDHLITLKDEGLVTFDCREIEFGEEWDARIKEEIENCDIMVCLVSVKFLNTDYINKIEIEKALKLGKTIIPIIIKPCDWERSKISKFQAAQRGKVVSLDNDSNLLGKIKENTDVEKAAFWTGIIKEFRKKIFKK